MPFRPPIPTEELRAIRERQPWNPDVIALLWEVRRLRGMILRAHQLHASSPRPVGVLEYCWDEFGQLLQAEPCVIERDRNVSEILEQDTPSRRSAGKS